MMFLIKDPAMPDAIKAGDKFRFKADSKLLEARKLLAGMSLALRR